MDHRAMIAQTGVEKHHRLPADTKIRALKE